MPVVINEFEVAPEPSQAAARGGNPQGGGEAEKPEPPDEHEIESALERRLERFERVWAC